MDAGPLGALLAVGTFGFAFLGPGLAHSAGGSLMVFVIPGLLGGVAVGADLAISWLAFLACQSIFYAGLMAFIGMFLRGRARHTLPVERRISSEGIAPLACVSRDRHSLRSRCIDVMQRRCRRSRNKKFPRTSVHRWSRRRSSARCDRRSKPFRCDQFLASCVVRDRCSRWNDRKPVIQRRWTTRWMPR